MKIKTKLMLAFGTLLILSFAIVASNLLTFSTIESDANFVNYSAKLRGLDFKMAQLSNIIVNSENETTKESLENSINTFDTVLKNIRNGNDELGLSVLEHSETIVMLDSIEDDWINKFKPAYMSILTTADAQALKLINSEVGAYVSVTNEMVSNYSAFSTSKIFQARIMNLGLIILVFIGGFISYIVLRKGILKPINDLNLDLKALSQGNGDLTKRIKTKSNDEIGQMIKYFNIFVENVHHIVNEIAEISSTLSGNMAFISNTTDELTKSTEMIAVSSMDVAEGSVLQNSKVDALNQLIDKIKVSTENVYKKANETLKSSEESERSVEKGETQVSIQSVELSEFISSINEASETVEDLNQSSEEIIAIVDLIHSISAQTNLLALNASIEAARAGEAGRGFAIVADEIRKLSEETAFSAKKISEIVVNIGDKTLNVKSSMHLLVDKTHVQENSMEQLKVELKNILSSSLETLEESKGIISIADDVNNEFVDVTFSAKEIQNVAVKNSEITQDVASAIEEQTASFQEVSANISSINNMVTELTDIVGRFKI